MSQYFELFQLPEQFDINLDMLTQRYHALAAQCHPDKFAHQSAFEQKQAMMMATTVNEAYRTLKSPLDRAAYLLQQQGIAADAPEHTHFAPEFLMQQMEWRECLEEGQLAHDETVLTNLSTEIDDAQAALEHTLSAALSEQSWEEAAELVRQGRFLSKLHHEIQAALP